MGRTAKSLAWNAVLKGYVNSDKINAVSEGAEALYLRLLTHSDDAGRYRGSARAVLSGLYLERWERGDVDEEMIEARLLELQDVGLVERYVVGGRVFVQVADVFRAGGDKRSQIVEHPAPSEGSVYEPESLDESAPAAATNALRSIPVHECTDSAPETHPELRDSGASTHHRTQEHKNEELKNSSSSTNCQLFPRAREAPPGGWVEEEDEVHPSRERSAAC